MEYGRGCWPGRGLGKRGLSMALATDEQVGFVDDEKILALLEAGRAAGRERALEVVAKARECKGLDLEELAILLQAQDEEVVTRIYEAALYVKETIYGRRMVFFAPLYVSNVCANNCLYCGFRKDNKDLVRRVLTPGRDPARGRDSARRGPQARSAGRGRAPHALGDRLHRAGGRGGLRHAGWAMRASGG